MTGDRTARAPAADVTTATTFADPRTRMLLSSDGSTTRLLDAAVGSPMRVEVRSQYVAASRDLPSAVCRALRLAPGAGALVRRSALRDEHGRCVSVNTVTASCHEDPRLGPVVTDTTRPLGRDLARLGLRRHPLAVDRTVWPEDDRRQMAARKTYLVLDGDQPVLHISEIYNPEVIPPQARSGGDTAPHRRRGAWRALPTLQQSDWPDPVQARSAARRLAKLPGLVTPCEIRRLQAQLEHAVDCEGFALQAEDRAETSQSLSEVSVLGRYRLLTTLGRSLKELGQVRGPVPVIARMAGPDAKPRSRSVQSIQSGGREQELPAYRGDMINAVAAGVPERTPDPGRIQTAYLHAAATLNALRNLGMANEEHPLFTSHEPLVLPVEEALTRRCETTGLWYATSAHTVWIGERTNDPGGAHVAFAAEVANPIGVKMGPDITADQTVALCRTLDPGRVKGRLTLISRMGTERMRTLLPELISAVAAEGHPVIWMCDPLHADTRETGSGHRTRFLPDVQDEIDAFFTAHRAGSCCPGGLHLEMTEREVTECSDDHGVHDAERHHTTACDPRLNPAQTMRCVVKTAIAYQRCHGGPS
jgi:3-deoxy-7-phosphoheptulonate synthase